MLQRRRIADAAVSQKRSYESLFASVDYSKKTFLLFLLEMTSATNSTSHRQSKVPLARFLPSFLRPDRVTQTQFLLLLALQSPSARLRPAVTTAAAAELTNDRCGGAGGGRARSERVCERASAARSPKAMRSLAECRSSDCAVPVNF